MGELLREINWTLLITLLTVSAVVAWAGDYIGMKLGKKRITLFHIRPKYTSRIMSVLTGVFIAFVTLFAISVTVEPVRTALFSMNYVQSQVTALTAELQDNRETLDLMELKLFESKGDLNAKQMLLQSVEEKLKKEKENLKVETEKLQATQQKLRNAEKQIKKAEGEQAKLLWENSKLSTESKKLTQSVSSLKAESDLLKKDIHKLREGRISALTGEVLAQKVINESEPITKEKINLGIGMLIDDAKSFLAYRLDTPKESLAEPILEQESVKGLENTLLNKKGRWLVRVTVVSNSVSDEQVVLRVDAYRTKLVYKKNEILITKKIPHGLDKHELEREVFAALKELNSKAVKDGVFRDPLTGNVGSVDSNDLMDTFRALSKSVVDRNLKFQTVADIYSEGPVRVKCILK